MPSVAPFYQAYVEIVPEAKNLRKTLAREFDSAGPEAGRAAGRGINSGVLGSVGKLAAPLAAAFASIGIGKIVSDSIANASDFAEAGTAITAVFGDADATIQKFAAGAAQSLGQSTNMTLDAAKTFGVFGKAAGLSGQELAGFSTDFITLAADLASFNNTSPEQAIQALGAGLRGESEPLRSYGILLDDAALKARATTLGIYSGTGALTQQQKVLAAQAEIMAQAGVQQGDFARTSGGLANQQRILSAGLENLSTTFGAILLPVMLTVVGFLNRSVLPALQGIGPAISGVKSILVDGDFTGAFREAFNIQEDSPIVDFLFDVREGVLGLKSILVDGDFTSNLRSAFNIQEDSPIVGFLLGVHDAVADIAPLFGTLVGAVEPLLPTLLDLWQNFSPITLLFKAIMPLLPQIVDLIGTLATTLGGALGSALTTIMPSIISLSGTLVTLLAGLFAELIPVLMAVVEQVGSLLPPILAAVAPLFAMVAGVITQVVNAVIPLIPPLMDMIAAIVPLIGALLPPFITLLAAILTPVIALVSALLSFLIPVLQFLITVLAAVITWVAKVITWFIQLVTGAGDAGKDLLAFFTNLPGMILDALGDMGSFLLNAGADLIQGFIDGITGMIGNVGDAIGGVMDFVGGFFPHSPAKRGPFSGSGWRAIKDAGLAVGDQFGAGLTASEPGFSSSLTSRVVVPDVAAQVDASVFGSSASRQGSGVNFSQTINAVQGQSAAEIAAIARNDRNNELRGLGA